MKLNNIYQSILIEQYLSDRETRWMWISPDNRVIFVPKLKHQGFIMNKYKDLPFSWDYDRVFDQALKDGWIRVVYEYYDYQFKGELSLHTYDKSRIIEVLTTIFKDFIKYGNKSIYIDSENPKFNGWFSTATLEGKEKLLDFIKN